MVVTKNGFIVADAADNNIKACAPFAGQQTNNQTHTHTHRHS